MALPRMLGVRQTFPRPRVTSRRVVKSALPMPKA